MKPSASNPEQEERNWLDLPTDVTANILGRVGMVDILENAQKVCTAWRKICKEPAMWRVVNMNDLLSSASEHAAASMFKLAVDRSQGQLIDITIVDDYDGELFSYAADRSSQVRRVELSPSVFFRTTYVFMKFPLLEEINFYLMGISKDEIKILGSCCPMLRTLKVNERPFLKAVLLADDESLMRLNEIPVAIGQHLVQLRHLELIGSKMTNIGLRAILDNCHHLESLDLRACFYLDLWKDVGNKWFEQIKCVKLPDDSLEDCPYICETYDEASELYEDYDDIYDHRFWTD